MAKKRYRLASFRIQQLREKERKMMTNCPHVSVLLPRPVPVIYKGQRGQDEAEKGKY